MPIQFCLAIIIIFSVAMTACAKETAPDPGLTQESGPVNSQTPSYKPILSAQVSPEEKEYAGWLEEMISDIFASIGYINDAVAVLQNDPRNDENLLVLARESVKLGIYYEEALEKEPPASMTNLHTALMDCLGEFKLANDALDSQVEGSVELWADHLVAGIRLASDIQYKYEIWVDQHK